MKKRNIMYLSITKMLKRELIFESKKTSNDSPYVNGISDLELLPVNSFKSFSCAKKRHKSNKSVEIVQEL